MYISFLLLVCFYQQKIKIIFFFLLLVSSLRSFKRESNPIIKKKINKICYVQLFFFSCN